MKRTLKIIIPSTILLAMVAVSVFTPFLYLRLRDRRTNGVVEDIPSSYYNRRSTSYVRNASGQLTGAEQLSLIYGFTESEMVPLTSDADGLTMTPYDAANTAEKYLAFLTDEGAWPARANANSRNWYAWAAKPYQVTDAAFASFTVYFWIITFTRYDSAEVHTVCLTDSGNFCFAYSGSSPLNKMPSSKAETFTTATITGKDIQTDMQNGFITIIPSSPFRIGYTAETTWFNGQGLSIPEIPHFSSLLEQSEWLPVTESAYLLMERAPNSPPSSKYYEIDLEKAFGTPGTDSYRLIVQRVKKEENQGSLVLLLPNSLFTESE